MKERAKDFLAFLLRHPLLVFLLGALVISIAAIFIFSPGGSSSSEEDSAANEKKEERRPLAYGGNIFKSEKGQEVIRKNRKIASPSYDNDPERKAEERERIDEKPALQQLPHYDAGIAIDVVNITPDGKPVVEVVRPMGTSQDIAEDIWKLFIESNNDSEDNYVVIHKEV